MNARRRLLALLLFGATPAFAANRKGSVRRGGTNSAGKGSHYGGGSRSPKKRK